MKFKERIEKSLNEEDAAVLISYIKTFKVNTKADTLRRLNYHINKCRKFLSTGNQKVTRARREYTRKLEYYMKMRTVLNKL
mgnify:CR=1 FL=1|jgi:hypothetical protein